MRGYDVQSHSARGVRYRFWLALRVKHPQVTWAEAGDLIIPLEQGLVTRDRLKRELEQVKEERDILKKALAILSRHA